LSRKKAEQFMDIAGDEIVICADTIVILDGEILEKPSSEAHARRMLRMLSGRTHTVATAVSWLYNRDIASVLDTAEVTFRNLEEEEISHYIEQYKPYDKAGAYGVQEWIGMVGIERIIGSFYTIMGLPIHKLYTMLRPFIVFNRESDN
jgi:septum formation protein